MCCSDSFGQLRLEYKLHQLVKEIKSQGHMMEHGVTWRHCVMVMCTGGQSY